MFYFQRIFRNYLSAHMPMVLLKTSWAAVSVHKGWAFRQNTKLLESKDLEGEKKGTLHSVMFPYLFFFHNKEFTLLAPNLLISYQCHDSLSKKESKI